MSRKLSPQFMQELSAGYLKPLLDRVKFDQTLMLAIRDGYINVYYRGGSLLKLEEQKQREMGYACFFDKNYIKQHNELIKYLPTGDQSIHKLPTCVRTEEDCEKWVKAIPYLKLIMDIYFGVKNKPEREFQQLVARENNSSTISNKSEYFITDIEYATDRDLNARFDIVGVRWLSSDRNKMGALRPVLVEMKYADDALEGNAGIKEHLDDIHKFLSDPKCKNELLEIISSQFNQLDELGLLTFNRNKKWQPLNLSDVGKPEVIFLLAGHNPRSGRLKTVLSIKKLEEYAESELFDLRFHVAGFSGYAMHSSNMLPLDEFVKLA